MRSAAARDSLRASSASPLTGQTSDWEHQRLVHIEVGGRACLGAGAPRAAAFFSLFFYLVDEAWTLTCAYMGYKQYYDPADDNHLQGALWLGKARDPSLVYR
jgi:hypothetical protein